MHGHGQNDGQIYHKAVAEQQGAHGAHARQSGDIGPIGGAGGSHGDLTDAASHGIQAAAEEVCDAAAENGQRQAGDILIGPEGDGQKAVNQAAQSGCQKRGDEGQQQTDNGGGILAVDLVEERGRKACNAAQIHDAGDTQVQVAGFLRQNFANGAVHDDGAEEHGGLEQLCQLSTCHFASPSFPDRRITR